MYARVGWGMMLCLSMAVSTRAVMIDSFESGPMTEGPDEVNLSRLVQSGLDEAEVIGGQREWFTYYNGSLDVAGPSGSLQFSHEQGIFEVANLRYGSSMQSASAQPLNADLTGNGNTQITIRMNRGTVPGDAPEIPLFVVVKAFSGVGTENQRGGFAGFRPALTDDAYVVQIPFASFESFLAPVDFTDLDGFVVEVSQEHLSGNYGSFEIEEISATAGLPGDYNLDGTVNLADYTVWRDSNGSSTSLPNENPDATTPGVVDQEDYQFWKSQFGATFPLATPSAITVQVPEPSAVVIAGLMIGGLFARRRV